MPTHSGAWFRGFALASAATVALSISLRKESHGFRSHLANKKFMFAACCQRPTAGTYMLFMAPSCVAVGPPATPLMKASCLDAQPGRIMDVWTGYLCLYLLSCTAAASRRKLGFRSCQLAVVRLLPVCVPVCCLLGLTGCFVRVVSTWWCSGRGHQGLLCVAGSVVQIGRAEGTYILMSCLHRTLRCCCCGCACAPSEPVAPGVRARLQHVQCVQYEAGLHCCIHKVTFLA
jgi:hypothetical protein